MAEAADTFGRRAPSYRASMSRGILGRLRARERRVVQALIQLRSGHTVLDAGCGAGFDAHWLRAGGADVLAVDASAAMVAAAAETGVEALEADVCSMSLERTFDRILCLGMLEFCARPKEALRTLRRHAHAGTRLIVLYPIPSVAGRAYRAYHRRSGLRVRLFGPGDMEMALAECGFTLEADIRATPLSHVLSARTRSAP